ncbi:hypothetical protein BJX99DRAFT_222278 [Aspergillus californicus]
MPPLFSLGSTVLIEDWSDRDLGIPPARTAHPSYHYSFANCSRTPTGTPITPCPSCLSDSQSQLAYSCALFFVPSGFPSLAAFRSPPSSLPSILSLLPSLPFLSPLLLSPPLSLCGAVCNYYSYIFVLISFYCHFVVCL